MASTVAAGLLSAVNRKIAIIGILAASIAAAGAANYPTTTVGVVNGNSLAFTAATGNSDTFTTFTNNLANAFATNYAGVWNFDGTSYTVNSGDTVTLSYGTSQSSSLILTTAFGSGDSIGQGTSGTATTSGGDFFAENGSAADRSFTPSKPLQTVSIFNLNRGDSSRTAVLTVTFLDNTTASTSGANGGAVYFHELSASSVTNPIVKFTISNSNLNRYDDLGFIISSYTLPPPPPPPWATATNSTTTNTLGFSFVNNSGSGLTSNTNTAFLFSTDSAGAPGYAQTNWNNCAQTGDNFSGGFAVSNSLGSATPLIVSWAGSSTGSSTTATNLNTSDGKLMDGYLAMSYANQTTGTVGANVASSPATTKPLVYVGGLKAWYQAQGAEGFGVVIYQTAGGSYDTTFDWVQSVTGSPTNNSMSAGADLTPRLFNTHSALFSGTYIKVPNTATNPYQSYGANYCVFTGLTNDAVLVRSGDTNEPWGSASMNGFQIVPIFATLPTAGTPTFSPGSPVYSGVPVTVTEVATGDVVHPALYYQWLTDGGSGGALTNMPGATNATVTLTPAGSGSSYVIQFQVIVTNFMGSVTSSVASLTVNPGAPVVNHDIQPSGNGGNVYAYVNGGLTFTANFNGSQPFQYQWLTSSSYPLTGATNTTLTLTNLQLSVDDGTYQMLVTNALGNNASSAATLTVLADPAAPDVSTAYPYDVFTNGPVAYWRFNETIDNSANSVQAYDYSGHNHNATYGNGAYDYGLAGSGYEGPLPSGGYPAGNFPGFEPGNGSVTLINNQANSSLIAPDLNLNTNAVTITAWIKPTGAIGGYWGLFMWVNGADKAGFGFGSTVSNSMAELGYTWNTNSSSTYNFHSGLFAPFDQWSFVALTITPTNTTIYLYYVDSSSVTHLSKAVQTINNSPEAFSGGTTWIGSDSYSGRNFNGSIDEVSVFNRSLSEDGIQNLFEVGSGISGLAPYITSDLTANPTNSSNYFPGQIPVQLTAAGAGAPPPAYQWQAGSGGVFTNLVSGGSFAGVNSGALSINPVTPAAYLDYRLLLTNVNGSATSSVYTVQQASVPVNGLWTACYQFTNSSGFLWYDAYGSGSYSGPGVLGQGGFWNPIPGGGQWSGGSFTSVSDYMDNGSTHSGVNCSFNNAGFSIAAATAAYSPTNRAALLSQFAYYLPGVGVTVTNAVTVSLPNGIYNLAFHADDIGWGSVGTIFTVHGANGDQSDTTVNTGQSTYFVNEDTSVVITNVQVSNGVLNVDAAPSSGNSQFAINAAEVQLVSYAPPTAGFSASPTSVFVNQSVTFVNAASPVTNLFWNFGDGNTLNTTVNGNTTHAYATPGTYTVSQTVKNQGGTASVTNTAYITVTSATPPVIGNVGMSGGSLVLGGTGGTSGQQYRILTSTNVALPLASWMPVWTNVFAPDGSFSYTNSSTTNGAGFFILATP